MIIFLLFLIASNIRTFYNKNLLLSNKKKSLFSERGKKKPQQTPSGHLQQTTRKIRELNLVHTLLIQAESKWCLAVTNKEVALFINLCEDRCQGAQASLKLTM